jgi:hypothetical protein
MRKKILNSGTVNFPLKKKFFFFFFFMKKSIELNIKKLCETNKIGTQFPVKKKKIIVRSTSVIISHPRKDNNTRE